MNRILKECSIDEKCSYIDNLEQRTHYKIVDECSKEYCLYLIERGWRRFGNMFFRPICLTCTKCESIKIDVQNYTFSKSERRVLKKAQHLDIVIQTPSISPKHIELFNAYHTHMHTKKSWDLQVVNPKNYYMSFVHGHGDFGKEILYYDENKLIGVDLVDILDDGISSIYFYYDPSYEKLSLGKLSLLKQIEHAKNNSLEWIYLGYYVEENSSLAYKSTYKPYHQLEGRCKEDENPTWQKT